jgi:hypothetical protein
MTTARAILSVSRPGKGKGRRTSIKLYDRNGNLIREHNGPVANTVAATLKRAGVKVVSL